MDAPVCRTCGKKHWSRLCAGEVTDPVTQTVTGQVTKPVTVTPPVTRDVPRSVAPSKLAALEVENEALRAEVVMLKRKLADVNKVPTTSTERMKKLRERRKQSPA
jgi:hypothetical protein